MERDLLQGIIGLANHAFKKSGYKWQQKILPARLGEDIIVTSSPGERNVTYLGSGLKQDLSFGSICVQPHVAGLRLEKLGAEIRKSERKGKTKMASVSRNISSAKLFMRNSMT